MHLLANNSNQTAGPGVTISADLVRRSQVAGHRSYITGQKSQSQVAGHRSQITGYKYNYYFVLSSAIQNVLMPIFKVKYYFIKFS